MTTIVSGSRVARNYVLLIDDSGLRHAIRLGSILVLSDADDTQGATLAVLPGNRSVIIQASLEDVLAWLDDSVSWPR